MLPKRRTVSSSLLETLRTLVVAEKPLGTSPQVTRQFHGNEEARFLRPPSTWEMVGGVEARPLSQTFLRQTSRLPSLAERGSECSQVQRFLCHEAVWSSCTAAKAGRGYKLLLSRSG
jgi:hypothetical protein